MDQQLAAQAIAIHRQREHELSASMRRRTSCSSRSWRRATSYRRWTPHCCGPPTARSAPSSPRQPRRRGRAPPSTRPGGPPRRVPARLRHLLLHARPTCLVADFCHPWASELAAGLTVPRLTFFSMSAFCLLCQHNVERFGAYDSVADDNAPVVVPGLARTIEVTRAQAPGFFRVARWDKFADDVERR
ncbi:Os04g0130433 [Oryza sativa Japonica Group]|uniref:Os04g0130433 protein n=2 Tax=Oryza sativa subsp. japonica TaxID=39947 RepID=A0A0P0W6G2_ORYSJ|nr:Os04g0130433 [Oryza sativa Japonica Group]